MSALTPFTLCGIIFNVVKHHWHLSRTQSISRLIECIYTIFPRYVDLERWIKTEITKLGDQLFLAMLWFAQFGLRGYFSWKAAMWPLGCNWPMFAISRQWLFSTETLCAVPIACLSIDCLDLQWPSVLWTRVSVAPTQPAPEHGAECLLTPRWSHEMRKNTKCKKILDRAAETCLLKPVRL